MGASTSIIYAGCDFEEPAFHDLGFGTVGVFTIRSPDRSGDPNEDSSAVIPVGDRSAVLVLADGLGGLRGGEVASRIAVTTIAGEVGRAQEDGRQLRAAIMDGFEQANRAILDDAKGGATTLAVLQIEDGEIRPFHVGDSIALAVGQRGKIKLQTVAHSPVGYAVESGVLDERDAMDHEHRHVVSNVVGAPDMRIDVGSRMALAKRDSVIIASDGLTDNLQTGEIVDRVRRGPLPDAMRRLAGDALGRMRRPLTGQPSKPDDLTFLVYRSAR